MRVVPGRRVRRDREQNTEAWAGGTPTANVRHWHGAAPDSRAVQFSVYTGELEWQTPVSDAEYAGKGK